MKQILLLILVFIFSCKNNDTKYRGYIYYELNKPLINVKVMEESTENFTQTDDKGYFELKRTELSSVRNLIVKYKYGSIYNKNEELKIDTIDLIYSGGIQRFKYMFLEENIDTIYIKGINNN